MRRARESSRVRDTESREPAGRAETEGRGVREVGGEAKADTELWRGVREDREAATAPAAALAALGRERMGSMGRRMSSGGGVGEVCAPTADL